MRTPLLVAVVVSLLALLPVVLLVVLLVAIGIDRTRHRRRRSRCDPERVRHVCVRIHGIHVAVVTRDEEPRWRLRRPAPLRSRRDGWLSKTQATKRLRRGLD